MFQENVTKKSASVNFHLAGVHIHTQVCNQSKIAIKWHVLLSLLQKQQTVLLQTIHNWINTI